MLNKDIRNDTCSTIYFQSIKTSIRRFDNVFDHFEQMFEADMLSSMPSFPHYNIVKTDKNKYDIEIALAYSKRH